MPITPKDIKEAMTYSFSLTEETFDIRGVSVEIWRDQCALNPYEDGEYMAPALWFYGYITEYGGCDLENPIWHMSPSFVSRHWRAIEALLPDVDSAEPVRLQQDYGGSLSNIRQEYYSEILAEMRAESWGRIVDYFDVLAALWKLQGVAADTFQSNGYCQGDSARGLIVHHPEWVKKVGFNGDAAKDMKSEVKTYGAWAWGDVYGFTVDDEESCGGFYGHDIDYVCEVISKEVNDVLDHRATIAAAAMEAARPDLYAPAPAC